MPSKSVEDYEVSSLEPEQQLELEDKAKPESKAKVPPKDTSQTVGFFQLFRYASGWDHILLAIAFLMSVIKSLVFPVTIVVYSEWVAMSIDRSLGIGTSSKTNLLPLFGGGKQL